MSGRFSGRSNKELIIEVICKIENIEEKLKDCRPICFSSENKLIQISERVHNIQKENIKYSSITSSVITLVINFSTKILNWLGGLN
jgi:hypothetical protein